MSTRMMRTEILNKLINPATQQFLKGSGLREGMRVLDLRCGIGTMTSWIANKVGPEGQVVAIDKSPEQLDIAREIAHEQGCENIDFVPLAASDIGKLKDKFDFIYCRFLMMHLKDPSSVLKKIYQLLGDGGVFACESVIIGHEFCYPKSTAFIKWRELNHDVLIASDKEPKTGMKLTAQMTDVGFHPFSVKLFQPVLEPGQQRQEMLINDMLDQAPSMVAAKLATEEEIDDLRNELQHLVNDESYFMAYCQSCQIAGIKNDS